MKWPTWPILHTKKDMLSSLENNWMLFQRTRTPERTKLNSLKRTISSSIDDESNWEISSI